MRPSGRIVCKADKLAGRLDVQGDKAAGRLFRSSIKAMDRIDGTVGDVAGWADPMVGIIRIRPARLASRRDMSRSGRSQR